MGMRTKLDYLTEAETSFLEIWLWEHAHGELKGEAHQLEDQNKVSILKVIGTLSPFSEDPWFAIYWDLTTNPNCPKPRESISWPWPGKSQEEIEQEIRQRVRKLTKV